MKQIEARLRLRDMHGNESKGYFEKLDQDQDDEKLNAA